MSVTSDRNLKEAILVRKNKKDLSTWQSTALKAYDAKKKRNNAKTKKARYKRANNQQRTDWESNSLEVADAGTARFHAKRKEARYKRANNQQRTDWKSNSLEVADAYYARIQAEIKRIKLLQIDERTDNERIFFNHHKHLLVSRRGKNRRRQALNLGQFVSD